MQKDIETMQSDGMNPIRLDETLWVAETRKLYDGIRIRSFRGLDVWKLAKSLSVSLYKTTRSFPKEESFGLTSQLRRAGVSIPANISEGWGRNTHGQFRAGVAIARGSLAEVEPL